MKKQEIVIAICDAYDIPVIDPDHDGQPSQRAADVRLTVEWLIEQNLLEE